MSECLWAGGSARVEQKMVTSLPLHSCYSPMAMKENPNTKIRKKYRGSILLSRDRILLSRDRGLLSKDQIYQVEIKFTETRSNYSKSTLKFRSQNQIPRREGQTLQSWYWIYYVQMEFAESGWLAHLVSRFACNTRMIVDASLNLLVSHIKISVTKT